MLEREHPLRRTLSGEIHARPYPEVVAPARLSFVALLSTEEEAARDTQALAQLCEWQGVAPPAASAKHFAAEMGGFHLSWERHSEFCTYAFRADGPVDEPFVETAMQRISQEWRQSLPGQVVAAAHIALEDVSQPERDAARVAEMFSGNPLVSSLAMGGKARVWTDFRVHADGFGRMLIRSNGMGSLQAGRLVQRLVELEVYRMMAMLALPLALEARPLIKQAEQRLSALAARLATVRSVGDDEHLLADLTQLASEIEALTVSSSYRFSATTAYYGLVQRRVEELREQRIEGWQPTGEFLFRRLVPAMETCQNVAQRQGAISHRIAQATDLLSTRVSVSLERQNQEILRSMDRRAHLQVRLQRAVEGLSVVAISYYLLGIINYALKAAAAVGLPVRADLSTGLLIPLVVGGIWLGVRRVRRAMTDAADGD